MEISHFVNVAKHTRDQCFILVRFNRFALTTGFYWSYTLLLKLLFLHQCENTCHTWHQTFQHTVVIAVRRWPLLHSSLCFRPVFKHSLSWDYRKPAHKCFLQWAAGRAQQLWTGSKFQESYLIVLLVLWPFLPHLQKDSAHLSTRIRNRVEVRSVSSLAALQENRLLLLGGDSGQIVLMA